MQSASLTIGCDKRALAKLDLTAFESTPIQLQTLRASVIPFGRIAPTVAMPFECLDSKFNLDIGKAL